MGRKRQRRPGSGRSGGQAAAALQQAQLRSIAEGAPARDWAAFVLLEPQKNPLSATAQHP